MTPASPWKLTTESLPPGIVARVRRPPAPVENKIKRRVASPEEQARIITLCAQGSTYAEVGVIVGMSSERVGKVYRRHARSHKLPDWRERRTTWHSKRNEVLFSDDMKDTIIQSIQRISVRATAVRPLRQVGDGRATERHAECRSLRAGGPEGQGAVPA